MPVTHGTLTLGGKVIVVFFGTVVPVTPPAGATWGDTDVTWSSSVISWSEASGTNLGLAGSSIVVTTKTAVTPGALTLTGQTIAQSRTISITHGAITYAGQSIVISGGTTFIVEIGALTLTGSAIAVAFSIAVTAGAVTWTGTAVVVSAGSILMDPGTLTLGGGTFSVTLIAPPAVRNPPPNLIASPELPGLQRLRRRTGLVRR